MKSVFLQRPRCVRWSHRWGGVREGDDRWDPIWTDLLSCQLSPRWLETLLVYRQPSKDACPPLQTEQAASPMSPLASLLPVEAKSDTIQSSVHTLAQAQIRSQCVNKCEFLRVDVQGLYWCTRLPWRYWRMLTFSPSTRNRWQVGTLAG